MDLKTISTNLLFPPQEVQTASAGFKYGGGILENVVWIQYPGVLQAH